MKEKEKEIKLAKNKLLQLGADSSLNRRDIPRPYDLQ